jgi:hypothetical protein
MPRLRSFVRLKARGKNPADFPSQMSHWATMVVTDGRLFFNFVVVAIGGFFAFRRRKVPKGEASVALDSGLPRQEVVVALMGLDGRRIGSGGDHFGGLQKGTAYPAVQFKRTRTARAVVPGLR